MITKYFYDEEDYQVILKLLYKYKDSDEKINAVFTRQMFLEQFDKHK